MYVEEQISTVLQQLKSNSPHVTGSVLVSHDGLPIVSSLPSSLEADNVAGINSILLNIGVNSSQELQLGHVEQLMIRGDHGYLVMAGVNEGAMLLVLTDEEVILGSVFHFMKKAIGQLSKLI